MDPLSSAHVDELVAAHQEFVRALARNVARLLPRYVEFDDLVAYGQVGLLEAARRYEHGHETAFTTFAYYRVRGAIFDGVRKLHGNGVRVGYLVIAAERGDELLEDNVAVSGDAERQADELGDAVDLASTAVILALHADELVGAVSPLACAEQQELLARLRAALAKLSSDDQELLTELYHEGRSMTDVARTRGRHKATVCRAHHKAIGALRRAMERAPEHVQARIR